MTTKNSVSTSKIASFHLAMIAMVVGLITVAANRTHAAGIAVGSSSLINALDYSDTFTINSSDRLDGALPSGTGLTVENNYGNTTRSWSQGKWSLNTDSSVSSTGASPYPGTNGAGSATGITQHGTVGTDWGIAYGLRDEFIVQFDAIQVSDRINITASTAADSIAGGLSVFFRKNGIGTLPEIGLYSNLGPVPAEIDSGLVSTTTEGQWYNYAVRFDIPDSEIEVYIDEVSLGVIDLSTFNGGSHNNFASSAFVNVGGNTGGTDDRLWTDNFQVGGVSVVPEPESIVLWAILGAFGLGYCVRRSRMR